MTPTYGKENLAVVDMFSLGYNLQQVKMTSYITLLNRNNELTLKKIV